MQKKRRSTSLRQPFPLDDLRLDRASDQPLHRQLYAQLRGLITRRTLPAGSNLPSSRSLAADLMVARNTVITAYQQLETEGFLVVRPGSGAWITDVPPASAAADLADASDDIGSFSKRGQLMVRQPRQAGFPGDVAFHPGTPDTQQFPFATWQRLLLRNMRASRDDLFGYYSLNGLPALRNALVGYLEASRGVRCDAEQIVVTSGAQAALDLLARVLLDPGDTVWMEEPGYLGAQSAFVAAGARLEPLRVEAEGWCLDIEALPQPPRLIYLTPSCQFPLGLTMPRDQRRRLLELAAQHGCWVIEDDFDCEYRFGAEPIPALYAGSTTQQVIYVGTFAKTLFPSLRLGFMVLPVHLARRLKRAISITGQFPPLILQATLADFIQQGHFARHLRRVRRLYADRRVEFLEHCVAQLGQWIVPLRGSTGIQTTWLLNPVQSDETLAAAAQRQRVIVTPLSTHYRHGRPEHGLVLGYAALDRPTMLRGFGVLRTILSAAPPGE